MNGFAWVHNPHSRKTEEINSMPIDNVCRRCKDKLEWRKKYRKYKPLTQPSTCNGCKKKNIRAAYHTKCSSCRQAGGKDLCGICFKEPCLRGQISRDLSIEEACAAKGPMKLREKKAFIRKLQREQEGKDEKIGGGGGGGGGGESCDEFTDSDSSADEDENDLASAANVQEVTMHHVDPAKSIMLKNPSVTKDGDGFVIQGGGDSPLENGGGAFEEVSFLFTNNEKVTMKNPEVVRSGNMFLVKSGKSEEQEQEQEQEPPVDMEAMKADMIAAFSSQKVCNFAAGVAQGEVAEGGNAAAAVKIQKNEGGAPTAEADEPDPFEPGNDMFGCSSAKNFPKFKF